MLQHHIQKAGCMCVRVTACVFYFLFFFLDFQQSQWTDAQPNNSDKQVV